MSYTAFDMESRDWRSPTIRHLEALWRSPSHSLTFNCQTTSCGHQGPLTSPLA